MSNNQNSSKLSDAKGAFSKSSLSDRRTNQIKTVSLKPPVLEKLKENLQKNWWVHVWQGLVKDEQAKHQKAMRQAVWLYLYLLVAANWKTGAVHRRLSTIISETGFQSRSVSRWLKLLREKGYIETQSTGRALQISITKWKPITRKKNN
jgi:DNA-binding MarR family transcriptional regulator